MDITNLNALTRSGSYPVPRAVTSGRLDRALADGTRGATAVVRDQQQPVEQVLQGELLQKRRKTSTYDTADLLDSMRAMDRLLRDSVITTSDTAPPRDIRRAIATYMQQTVNPNTLIGAAAASTIDYFA